VDGSFVRRTLIKSGRANTIEIRQAQKVDDIRRPDTANVDALMKLDLPRGVMLNQALAIHMLEFDAFVAIFCILTTLTLRFQDILD
jgi:hypothetical protein